MPLERSTENCGIDKSKENLAVSLSKPKNLAVVMQSQTRLSFKKLILEKYQ